MPRMITREQYGKFFDKDFPIDYDTFVSLVNRIRASRFTGRSYGRSYGSSGRSTSDFYGRSPWREELAIDLENAVKDWYKREKSRLANNEPPGWESEDIYIPMLQAKYGHLTGMSPAKVARMFYSARRPYESGLRR